MARVAFIGLGVMGFPMAGHLAAKGHEVTVYNRTASRAEEWPAAHGGARRRDPGRGRQGRARSSSPASATTTTCAASPPAPTAPSRRWPRARSSSTTPPPRPPVARELAAAAAERGAGFVDAPVSGGQAGARERRADGDVRRRPRRLRPRRAGDRRLCPRLPADGSGRRRPAHQDGQPDLHRRPAPGPLRGPRLRRARRPRRRGGARGDRQGRGRLLADGEPRQDDARGQVRLRLRRRLDAQGPRHLPRRGRGATAPRCRPPR